MALSDIRTEIGRVTDKTFNFGNPDRDAATNTWYLTCWRHLDKVAPNRTRITQTLSLVKDQLTAYTLTTALLAVIYINPPHARRNERTFIMAIDDDDFRRHEDQAEIRFAQESETSLITRPAIDTAMDATVHYVRKPPTITTSQAQLHFDDQTLAAGAIGLLLHSINFADAFYWMDERIPARPAGVAYTKLRNELNTFAKFGNNSNLTMSSESGPWV